MKFFGKILSFLFLPLLFLGILQNPRNDSVVDTARLTTSAAYTVKNVYTTDFAAATVSPSPKLYMAAAVSTASPKPSMVLATPLAAASHGEKRIEQEDMSVKRGLNDDVVVSMQRLLIYYGYLPRGSDDGIFGKNTEQAVKSFQETNGLWVTGVIDGETYDALYYGTIIKNGYDPREIVFASANDAGTPIPTSVKKTPSPTRTPVPSEPRDKITEMVWIPNSGKRYHRRESCSNMKNPRYVTIDEAIRRGFTPCKKCY